MFLASQSARVLDILSIASTIIAAVVGVLGAILAIALSRSKKSAKEPAISSSRTLLEYLQITISRLTGRERNRQDNNKKRKA
jgi:hypothetical protein